MQLLIDTDDMPTDELAAAVNMLDDILRLRRTPSVASDTQNDAATPSAEFVSRATSADAPAGPDVVGPTSAPPPPPAVPLTIADVVSDADPEIEIDDEGTVTALTTSVQLQAPPPPALAAAPPPPTPAPPGPVVAAELDSRGYPWDGRIHASNRSQTIKKEWKLKRGVDKNLVVACEAQNKPGNDPSVAPAAAATVIPAATVPVSQSATSAPPPPAVPPVPSVSGAPSVATPPAVPSTASAPIDFRGLMMKIAEQQKAGKLSDAQVNSALLTVGLQPQDMAQLIGNALYIASVNAAIDACLSS